MKNKIQTEQKLIERCSILADIVKQISPLYKNDTTPGNQKQLIETMLSAAIWSFPLYKVRYGRFNYITPCENKLLVTHQKESVFLDPTTAYQKAGIQLLAITPDEFV